MCFCSSAKWGPAAALCFCSHKLSGAPIGADAGSLHATGLQNRHTVCVSARSSRQEGAVGAQTFCVFPDSVRLLLISVRPLSCTEADLLVNAVL